MSCRRPTRPLFAGTSLIPSTAQTFTLASATKRDPSAHDNTSTESGGTITLNSLASIACNTPATGTTWAIALADENNTALSFGTAFTVHVWLDVTVAPTLTRDHWVTMALTNDPSTFTNYRQIGLHYDASPGPDIRYGQTTDSAGQTGVSAIHGRLEVSPAGLEGAWGIAYTTGTTKNGLYNSFSAQALTSGQVYLCLAHGRSTSTVDTSSLQVKVRYKVYPAVSARPA